MKWTAIIIDDEPFIRDVINALGHWDELEIDVVGEASDGVAGIELVKQLAPDIVITDVKMPRLDGLGLAAELNTYDNPPQIIIVSGYDDFELVRQALADDGMRSRARRMATLMEGLDGPGRAAEAICELL